MKRTLCVLVALMMLGAFAAAQRLPRNGVPSHYDITLTPDLKAATFAGEETIELMLAQPTDTIVLNAAEIQFQSVSLISKGVAQEAAVTTDDKSEMATFKFPNQIAAGPATLHIKFTGILNDKLRGFYLSKGKTRNYATTQFEATDARRAFPCFDEPDMKATFTLTFVVDNGDIVLANTRQVSDTPGPGDGKHTIKFEPSLKMSTYLVAFAVGDWKCVEGEQDGIPLRVCGTPQAAPLGAYALQAAKDSVKTYNQYFGVKYPFGKLDSLGLPDFSAGAMENIGLITWREALLMLDEKTASEEQKQTVVDIMAHEVAHMWFGDLVTMKWWNDVWLNEGFASWVPTKPVAAAHPEWNEPLQDVQGTTSALNTDSLVATRPIRAAGTEAETPDQINLLFDGVAYGKTASVLRMIEGFVGVATFQKGIQAYIKKHSYSNAAAEDFWNTMAQATLKPIDKIMASYVKNPGAPLLDVSANGSQVTVSQQRFFYDPKAMAAGSPELWVVPVCFTIAGAATPRCFLLDQKQQTFSVPGKIISANYGGRGHYRVAYSAQMLADITPVVQKQLGPGEQIALLRDTWALVRAGRRDVGDFLKLAEGFKDSRSPNVLQTLASPLIYIEQNLTTEADRESFRVWLRAMFSPAFQELGWTPKPGETTDQRELRATLIGLVGFAARNPKVLADARPLTEKVLQDYGSVDPSIRSEAFFLTVADGDAALYDRIVQKLTQAKSPAEFYLYFGALSQFRDTELLKRTLEYALTSEVRNQDTLGMIARVIGNPAGRQLAWEFVKTNWGRIRAKLPEGLGGVEAALAGSTGGFCTVEMRDDVAAFFKEHPLQGSDRPLRRAMENMGNCIDLRGRQQDKLAAWLQQNNHASAQAPAMR